MLTPPVPGPTDLASFKLGPIERFTLK
jgi:hypothetical protein